MLAQLDSKRSDGRWCAVFVASVSANPSLECNLRNSRVTWLSTNRMQVLPYLSVTVTPWASDAGRKNIGYLYALAEGAHVLLDADAMAQYRLEELWDSALRPARPRSLCRAAPSGSSTGFANLLPLFGLSRSEHRAGPVARPTHVEASGDVSSTTLQPLCTSHGRPSCNLWDAPKPRLSTPARHPVQLPTSRWLSPHPARSAHILRTARSTAM